jgi:hypothetical protein
MFSDVRPTGNGQGEFNNTTLKTVIEEHSGEAKVAAALFDLFETSDQCFAVAAGKPRRCRAASSDANMQPASLFR